VGGASLIDLEADMEGFLIGALAAIVGAAWLVVTSLRRASAPMPEPIPVRSRDTLPQSVLSQRTRVR
jgi:hypothetical protein